MQKHYFDEIEAYIKQQGISAGELQPRELVKTFLNEELGFAKEDFPDDFSFHDPTLPGRPSWWGIVRHPYWGWGSPNNHYGCSVFSDTSGNSAMGIGYGSHFGADMARTIDACVHLFQLPEKAEYLEQDFDWEMQDGPIVRIWAMGSGDQYDYSDYGSRIADTFSEEVADEGRFKIHADPTNNGRHYLITTKHVEGESWNRVHSVDQYLKMAEAIAGHRNGMESLIAAEQRILLGDCRKIKSEFARVSKEYNELKASIAKREEEIRAMINTYSSLHRLQTDDKVRVQTMPPMMNSMALSFARMGEGVIGLFESDNRIIGGEMVGDSISFTTHPFNMMFTTRPWCNDCDESWNECVCEERPEVETSFRTIPSLMYTIDISNGYDQDYIQIHPEDDDYDYGYHPHVQDGHPCLGDAGLGIAEAWGRRDWESVVNILLAWHAIYNPASPYYPEDEMNAPLADVDRAGWVIPTAQEVAA